MPAPIVPRLERLARLHGILASAHAEGSEGVPAQTLLSEVGGERKALYRAVEELREAGAPVEYSDDTHLWRYGSTWNFPAQFLSTLDGPVALRLSLDFLMDPPLRRLLEGVVAVEPRLSGRGGSTLPRLTARVDPHLLGPVARALKERRRASFSYLKPGDDRPRRRRVEPLEIFEWDGMPYLQARDADAPGLPFKRFALSRVSDLEVLEERFRPPARGAQPTCLGAFCGAIFRAEFEADAKHAVYVRERRWHPDQEVRERPGGAVRFSLPFGDHGEAARWILGHGPGFRPVSPAPLVREWKRQIADLSAAARG